MATYPVKMLKDVDGTLFIPLTNSDSVQTSTGDTLEDLISSKADSSELSNYVALNGAQTITGTKTFTEFTGGLLNNAHIENTYINTQPEGTGSILPFLYNDLAFYYTRGGTTTIYTTTDTDYTKNTLTHTKDLTPSGTANMFDGSPSYCTNWGISATTDVIVIDMSLPANFAYSTYFYIDFGTGSWYARKCKLLLWNSNNPITTYTLKKEWDETTSYHFVKTSYSFVNSGGTTVQGFNRIRIVLTSFGTVNPRVAQIGLINYGSSGVRNTYMSRGIDDYIFRNITPNSNNTYNLGDSSHKWANVYATNFNGNASTASLLKCVDSGSSTDASTWTNYTSDNKTVVWGQKFIKSAYNPDSGDISLSIEKVNDSTSRLNMSLDGKIVASGGFQGNLEGTASKATGDKNGNDITTTYYKASNPNGYTSNTGTVTSVGLTAGSGISISGGPVTSSGNITVGHSNSITAQATSGLYPIKIDAQGHITQYGEAYEIATTEEIKTMLQEMGLDIYTAEPISPTDYIYYDQDE